MRAGISADRLDPRLRGGDGGSGGDGAGQPSITSPVIPAQAGIQANQAEVRSEGLRGRWLPPLVLALVPLSALPARAAAWRMTIELPARPALIADTQAPEARHIRPKRSVRRRIVHHAPKRPADPAPAAREPEVPLVTPAADARDPARQAPVVRAAGPTAPQGPAVPAASQPPHSPAAPAPPVDESALAGLELAIRRTEADGMILLPFNHGVGAAAFRRGDQMLVVFDAAKPLDVTTLRDDPVFSTLTVEVLPSATLLRLHAPPHLGLTLHPVPEGWTLSLTHDASPPRGIAITPAGGGLALAASRPGHVVAVTDPVDGGILLVGTQLQDGQGIESARQAPEFALLPTLQGVVVEPLSDRLRLEPGKDEFRLTDATSPLALRPRSVPDQLAVDAEELTHRLDLPARPTEALAGTLRAQLAVAANTPPLSRGVPRLAVARTMIALGMGPEALGALHAAAMDDPRLVNDRELLGLEGVAAVLAYRPGEASMLADSRLSGTDEIRMWRALRDAMMKPGPGSAAVLAHTAPMLLSYPEALRARLLPLALETMEAHGQAKAAGMILAARRYDPSLAFARALEAEEDGDTAAALAGYDALVKGRDRLARIKAALRAIDLRLATKAMTPKQAIDALGALDMAWRGDAIELARRERLAALQLEVGAWRPAIALLRDSAIRFPDVAPEIHARLRAAVEDLLSQDASHAMLPLDFVELLAGNADVLGEAAGRPAMQARLADRLLALDLPDEAAPLLERLMRAAPPDAGRAAAGARLAALRLASGDGPGATQALVDSEVAADLPASLVERRALLMAQASAKAGDAQAALTALTGIGTTDADRMRADLLERSGDLAGAVAALNALVGLTVPLQGTLDAPARATILRLAALAARTHDQATLTALRERVGHRLGSGEGADTIRLLLAAPVSQMADLARAGKETALAGAVAAELRARRASP